MSGLFRKTSYKTLKTQRNCGNIQLKTGGREAA